MKQTLRSLLLLTTALTLVACDDTAQTPQSEETSGQNNESPLVGFYAPVQMPVIKTVSGSYLAGQHAQSRHDWSKASDYFGDILNKTPNNADIERRVMALSLGSGNFESAVSMAGKLVEKDKGESLAALIVALDDFKNARYDAARTRTDTIKADGLSLAIVPLLGAWIDGAEGKFKPETLKDSPSFLYQAILIADFAGDKAAIQKLAKSYNFTHTPTPIAALEDIADVFAKYGEKDEAKEIYIALRNALQDQTEDLTKKIESLSAGRLPETRQVTPQQGLARALLDTARLLSNGYEDSGLLFAQMSYFLDPNESGALEQLAQFAADNKQYKDAIAYLSKIDTKGNREQVETIERQTAMLLEMDGQKDEAIRVLSDLVEKNNNVSAQIQIGDIYRESEKYKEALEAYNKAFDMLDNKVPQEHWQLLFSRGIVNERLANWDSAEKDLTDALAYEPDQPYVLNYLGYTWADQDRNLDKAAEMIEKAARLKPDDGAIIDSLGWVYFRIGKFSDAVKTLENAVELQPYESEINDHLGDAYWRVGRKQEARFQWKRALSFTKNEKEIEKIQAKIDNGLPQSAVAIAPTKEKLATND
ncbi:MAG TPA: tetratricopeptide repeat protein [Alphaproteobacteria bacterium]|nr:tetratricopeptide repeat protein [Alphaproteobacteria bacterium]HNS43705.1 tetratricopeptide repeat protein [Alphaproteobacteria bacterium]